MRNSKLDRTDVRILAAVQAHGRLSKSKLAEIVNLSPTPCWARLERLKVAGLITGFHADLALSKICTYSEVVVTVSLTHHRKIDFDRFETHIQNTEAVTECFATGGGMDYVLKVVTPNLSAFQDIMETMLEAELGIDRYMTYIVTRSIKNTYPNVATLAAAPQ
jgi:Lrp/AsnC family transcriptional regulator of ectoine degradation